MSKIKWLKRCAFILATSLLISIVPFSSTATSFMDIFKKTQNYQGQFTDVSKSAWYYKDVINAYEYGLVGDSNGKFNPSGNVTIAEALTFAARVICIYNGDQFDNLKAAAGNPWYSGYIGYVERNGLIDPTIFSGRFEQAATRAQMAYIFYGSLSPNEFEKLNKDFTVIPDMGTSEEFYNDVLQLFCAGIVTGSDASGNFKPQSNITRAEAAAILNRLVNPALRKVFMPLVKDVTFDTYAITMKPNRMYEIQPTTPLGTFNGGKLLWKSSDPKVASVSAVGVITAVAVGSAIIWATDTNGKRVSKDIVVTVELGTALSSTEIFTAVSPAVFSIVSTDKSGKLISHSSGFFVNEDGTAYTAIAPIDGLYSMSVKTADGKEYKDVEIIAYDRLTGAATLHVKGNIKFPVLKLKSAKDEVVGSKIYCVSSQTGEKNTITEGLIAAKRADKKNNYIQFTSPITEGSVGGPLVNSSGETIGMAMGSMEDGQNVNFALYSDIVQTTKSCDSMTLNQFYNRFYGSLPELDIEDIKTPKLSLNNVGFDQPLSLAFGKLIAEITPIVGVVHYYSVDCPTAGLLNIEILTSQNTYDTKLTLFDKEGNILDYTIIDDGTATIISFEVPASGTFIFSVGSSRTTTSREYYKQAYALYSILLPING